MNKKLWTLIAILILIVGCLAIHDLIQTKQVKSKLESMEVQISKTDNVEETRINLEITGEIPKAYTKLTVFADNRYLEFQPVTFQKENGVSYEGLMAGGAEASFSITSGFDGDLTLSYLRKNSRMNTPLVYAYLESQTESFIFPETSVRSKSFELKLP